MQRAMYTYVCHVCMGMGMGMGMGMDMDADAACEVWGKVMHSVKGTSLQQEQSLA